MLVAADETRPRCKWRDHNFQPTRYIALRTVVMQQLRCTKCGRFIHKQLVSA